MENLTPLFIAITAGAVLLQALLLAFMYLAMRKATAGMEAIANEVKGKAVPALETAEAILTEIRPKLQVISDNLLESTILAREQIERLDATVSDVVDRARLQVIRADELLSRTLDRVEQASDMVHSTVVSPIRQVSGIYQGITAGIEFLLGNRHRRNGGHRETRRPVPQDEMFI